MEIGFVGVGAMGAAMAGHVANAGHRVFAYDADPKVLSDATVGTVAATSDIAELVSKTEVFIVVVNTDDQSRSVVEGILGAKPRKGAVVVVAATNHPGVMIELKDACADQGIGFVDAPVCYGRKGAENGDLISLCGGSQDDIDKVRPVLMAYSRSVEHMGPVGTGQLGKACNNMMHWAACVASYETLALAKACGVDAQDMRETLLKCPAYNRTLDRWDNSRFTWHEKDMDVVLDLSQQAGLSLPLFGAVDQLVKRLGPDQVRQLLHEKDAEYLGLPIAVKPLNEVVKS